jgi:hypothetical protein
MTEVNKICCNSVVLPSSGVRKVLYMIMWKFPSLVVQPETSRRSNSCYVWTERLNELLRMEVSSMLSLDGWPDSNNKAEFVKPSASDVATITFHTHTILEIFTGRKIQTRSNIL